MKLFLYLCVIAFLSKSVISGGSDGLMSNRRKQPRKIIYLASRKTYIHATNGQFLLPILSKTNGNLLSFGHLRDLGIVPMGGETSFLQTLWKTNYEWISGVMFYPEFYNPETQEYKINRHNVRIAVVPINYATDSLTNYNSINEIIDDYKSRFESQLRTLIQYDPKIAGYPRVAEASQIHLRAMQLRQLMGDKEFVLYIQPWRQNIDKLQNLNVEEESYEKIPTTQKYYDTLYPKASHIMNDARVKTSYFFRNYGEHFFDHFKFLDGKPNKMNLLYQYFLKPLTPNYQSKIQLDPSDKKLMLHPLPMFLETDKIINSEAFEGYEYKLAPKLNLSQDILNIHVFNSKDKALLDKWLKANQYNVPVKIIKNLGEEWPARQPEVKLGSRVASKTTGSEI